MITNNVLGIIFANVHDMLLGDLTKTRSMASVPFGGRYRVVDFMLSNLTNAGIGRVGVITKANYLSLMSHLGNGKPWDLDRKNGGLFILPPYSTGEAQVYTGHLQALAGLTEFLNESEEEYVMLCDADVVANINFKAVMRYHIEKNADLTVVCTAGKKPQGVNDIMSFTIDDDHRITGVRFNDEQDGCYSLDVILVKRELLIKLVEQGVRDGDVSISHGVFEKKYKELKIYSYCHTGFSAVMDSVKGYYDANMSLLDFDVRQDLFNRERPVYTKSRDDMPAKYGLKSDVSASLIADGCVIEGTVKNSVLFRGVRVEAGAVVENCVLMEGTVVGANSKLTCLITDRSVTVTPDKKLDGKRDGVYISKRAIV